MAERAKGKRGSATPAKAPASDQDTGDQVGVQSVETGIELLLALASLANDAPPPMLKTIAAAAGIPPAKAHRYLVSFTRTDMVERDAATGRYRLGASARMIGVAAIRGSDFVRAASRRLPQLCEDTRHSAALAVWGERGPTIVWVEEVRRPITISTRVGEILPLLASATGRVFGAYLPAYQTQALLGREVAGDPPAPPESRPRKEDAEKLFAEVKRHGVGWTRGGLNATVNALAAPVFDYRSALVGAIALLGPAASFDPDPAGATAAMLRKAAADVSQTLGHPAAGA
jgi:DNA-binding IclR family transcriptional regulator